MVQNWINPKYLNRKEINKIKSNFIKSKPYPNCVLSEFFDNNKLLGLKNEILKEKFEKIDKDLFTLSHTKDLLYSTNPFIREFYELMSSAEFVSLMAMLTNKKLSSKIDMQSHKMLQGDYLLFHDDVVEGRAIAYIVYLETLNPEDGGALRLYDVKHPLKPVKQVHPKFNSFACFKVSEKSLHDVEEVKSEKQRLTIGGWFYGK